MRALARVRLNADGRPLAHHVQDWVDRHDIDLEERNDVSHSALPTERSIGAPLHTPPGEFGPGSGEFRFNVNAFSRPARPWINVLANPGFGTQLSEAGGGYSWAVNSRLNQLTPWSNDPVADPPGEWFLLQDLKTMQAWSVAPSAAGEHAADYHVVHGQGYSHISHRRGTLEVRTTWCVDAQSAVKQVQLRLVNRGHRSLRLRAIGIVEWILGAARGDRSTAHSALSWREPGEPDEARSRVLALTCTQRERSAGFGGGTAFLALAGAPDENPEWTCDRREFFDARGHFVVPDHFGLRSGGGLDPCAAIASNFVLRPGDAVERVFLLGYADSPANAAELIASAAAVPPAERLQQARAGWDAMLGATTVQTPDPLFDAMVNRWLLYQTVACRLWARAGFYQAGGAYGFRDQLQDAMALAWAAPEMLRRQIVLGASRQFAEGDVQHWWHAPQGAGVRTHFSDDLLWLPYACSHYLEVSGDHTVLDEAVPFLDGPPIPAGAEDAYYTPTTSAESASVFEHCARAIDRSLTAGAHGLPLMGSGDWNDGMNRVGSEGRGESVWLAWFLCAVVRGFAPLARSRGETARALRWEQSARGWQAALQGQAWDGQWFRRAFFDDGSPLGSAANPECRIDLIAQAWSVLADATPPAFQRIALNAMEARLVDRDHGLIKLLDPPLVHARPSAGYIQAYPPGVRENGGQYSHAAVWALMAQAESGHGDAAYRYFTYLSPAHRSRDPAQAVAYAIEPYVMAGDVYTAPPYVGRGGWSWYTGSAAWLHRAAIESMFGLKHAADMFSLTPCLPSHWDEAELTLRRDGRRVQLILKRRAEPQGSDEQLAASRAARLLQPGESLRWSSLDTESRWLLPLAARVEAADVAAAEARA